METSLHCCCHSAEVNSSTGVSRPTRCGSAVYRSCAQTPEADGGVKTEATLLEVVCATCSAAV